MYQQHEYNVVFSYVRTEFFRKIMCTEIIFFLDFFLIFKN